MPGADGRAKVLHLIWALDLGGAERQVLEMVRRIDRSRFEPVVGCLVRKGRWGEQLEREGVRVHDLAKRPLLDPMLPLRLARIMRAERVDIVHTHAFTAATWGRLAALLARVPVVIAHEHSAFSLPLRVCRAVDRALVPATTRWIVVCEALAADLVREEDLPPARMIVVHNGSTLPGPAEDAVLRDRARAVRADLTAGGIDVRIGTIGRLEERKGLEVFLDAVARAAVSHPRLGAVIVGAGPLRAALEEQARALGIAERVRFTGRREDVAVILRALDAFVLPSHTEGLSISLVEAAAAGLPIVATRVGGNGEVIEDGTSGLLVPPGDAGALAAAIARVVDAPGEAARLGASARRTAYARFTAERMTDRIHAVYDEALAELRTRRPAFKTQRPPAPLKRLVRRAIATAAREAISPERPPALRILTYHRVNPDHPGDRMSVHPRAFAAQLEELHRTRRPVVALDSALAALRSEESLPAGAVAITFDDGFRDNHEHAFPLLRDHGMPATFFLATAYIGTGTGFERYAGCCGEDGGLDWEQVKEMLAAGHAIGGHSQTHRELARLGGAEVRAEVEGSRRDILERAGVVAHLFCYPRGSENAGVRRIVREAGYAAACSVYPGANPAGVDLYLLRRTEVSGDDSLADFRLKLVGGFDAWHGLVQRIHPLAH